MFTLGLYFARGNACAASQGTDYNLNFSPDSQKNSRWKLPLNCVMKTEAWLSFVFSDIHSCNQLLSYVFVTFLYV